MKKATDVKSMLFDAQKASAIIRSLHYSWVELPGAEVETLLELSSKYADSVTRHLAILSGDEGAEEEHAATDR